MVRKILVSILTFVLLPLAVFLPELLKIFRDCPFICVNFKKLIKALSSLLFSTSKITRMIFFFFYLLSLKFFTISILVCSSNFSEGTNNQLKGALRLLSVRVNLHCYISFGKELFLFCDCIVNYGDY